MSGSARDVDTATFDELVATGANVVVDFWAAWCGPCKALAPVVDEVAADLAGRVDVVKVDVDAHPELAQRFGVLGIPTLLVFADGDVRGRLSGRTREQLVAEISAATA